MSSLPEIFNKSLKLTNLNQRVYKIENESYTP